MWGIIPAAGRGSRIQPLAFSKELLPVGSRVLNDVERPCAFSEYTTCPLPPKQNILKAKIEAGEKYPPKREG